MLRRTFTMMAGAALVATAFIGAAPASAQGKKIVLAVPGIPPIYSVTIAFVAQKQGFFKKYGADVEIKPFDNGTAAARGGGRRHRSRLVADAAGDQSGVERRRAAGRHLRHA